MTSEERMAEVDKIIAEAAELPLLDAAFLLLRRKSRLDTLEGRPTPEEVAINRALTIEQWAAKYRYTRAHADEGPMFEYLKRAHPQAGASDVRHAILEAVRFDDACFKHFSWDGDFWDACVRAVALAAKTHPHYLEATYRDARNHVAHYMK